MDSENYLERKILEIPPDSMPRLSFWGEQHVPSTLESKYTFIKQDYGTKTNMKSMLFKVPNIKRLRRTILTRKLLSINHAFSRTMDRFLIPRVTRNDNGLDVDEVEEKIVAEAGRFKRNFEGKSRLQLKKEHGMQPAPEVPTNNAPEIKIVPNPKAMLLACNDGVERFKPVSILEDELREVQSKVTNEAEVERKQLRSRLYAKSMSRDLYSMDIDHAEANSRITATENNSFRYKSSLVILLLEILRTGLAKHDWALVSKCLESLTQNDKMHYRSKWINWTGGMLALTNIYKDDISKVVTFHRAMQVQAGGYPVKYGIDTAIWLIQKGYFVTGTAMLESEQEKVETTRILHSNHFDTIRRRNMDFIAEVINAVCQYAIYKTKDPDSPESIQFAESVLIMFESLVEKSEMFQNDCTVFLDPVIELMLKVRGKFAAQDLYKKLCEQNYKNGILSEMYLKFLKVHFPDYQGEIDDIQKDLDFYNFEYRGNEYTANREALSKFTRRKRALGKKQNFQKLELPGFSW